MARDLASRTGNVVDAMEEAGPSCTASQAAFRELLDRHAPLDEAAAARILALVARRHGGKTDTDDSSQAALAAALATLSLTHSASTESTWNLDVLLSGLAPEMAKLSPERIAEHLDHDSFALPDARAFLLLMSLWRRATGEKAFPLSTAIQRVWKNAPGQIAFLRFASTAPPEIFSFEGAARKLPPLEGLQGNKSPMGTPNQAWLALDLLSTLSFLYEAGHGAAVRQILELPLAQCPEVLVLSFASARSDWSALARDACDAFVVKSIASGPNSPLVLPRLWAANREALLRGVVALYEKDANNISRVLDVCQDLKALTDVLEATPFAFALELAALAARREYLNLEKWLQERLTAHGVPFVQAALKFLDAKLTGPPLPEGPQASRVPLSAESRAILLRVLAGAAPNLAPEIAAEVSRLTSIAQGVAVPGLPAVPAQPLFPQDVEDEANDNFQKVYQGKETSDHLLARLQAFKQGSTKEQQVYACMVHNLFDEYRFFPKYPEKERHITALLLGGLVQRGLVDGNNLRLALQLMLTAVKEQSPKMLTFGVNALLVCQERLTSLPQICQAVLQVPAVREASPELAQLCERVVAGADPAAGVAEAAKPPLLPPGQLADAKVAEAPDAAAKAKLQNGSGLEGGSPGVSLEAQPFPQTPPGLTASGVVGSAGSVGSLTPAQAGLAMDPNRAFQAINAETLEQASQNVDYPVPPQSVQDKVAFHVNNLSTSNLGAKAGDIKKALTPESWPWFANYMVVKRAAQEPNFHGLYIELTEAIGDRELQAKLLETTYKYVRILLRSERVRTHSGERSLLKNLGSWLGRLTIARSKPVRHRDMDLKGIIYEAYEQGRMIAVLPFVNKVLEPCKDSKVFKPPNPWVQSILALVAEIYAQDKLKLNLKFEIELLFRNMGIQISDAKPSSTLAAHKRQIVNNTDFAQDKVVAAPAAPAASQAAAPSPGGAARPPTPGQAAPGPPAVPPPGPPTGVPPTLPPIRTVPPTHEATAAPELPAPALPGVEQGLLANLHNYVQINAGQLGRIAERCKRIVPIAVDRAIVELINPIVEKSVTTACMTTQELVSKDFAFESDGQRMRKAAHLMVTSLAGSMALVSCRDAMRTSLSSQLRALLSDLTGAAAIEEEELDHAVNVLTNDNLELACTVIEKTATDKAIREIDDRLMPAYQARAKARAAGQEFMDRSVLQGRFPMQLPPALLPRGQLTPPQQLVYEDFARIPRTAPAVQPAPPSKPASMTGSIETAASLGSGVTAQLAGQGSIGGQAEAAIGVANRALDEVLRQLQEKYTLWQQRLDAHVDQDPQAVYRELPREHELLSVVAEIAEIAGGREDAVLLLARKIFTRLFEVQNARLHTGASVAALTILRDAALKRLPAELTGWWIAIVDERKWRRDTGEALVRARLFQLPDLDAHLAKVLSSGRLGAPPLEFAAHIVRACIVMDPVLAAADLFNTLEMLAKLARTSQQGPAMQLLVEQARRPKSKPPVPGPEASDPAGLRQQTITLFEAFVRACEEQPAERRHDAFVAQLQAANLLKMDDLTERFFRILTELAVRHCANSDVPGAQANFMATDALARLVVTLVISHGGGLDLLSRVLGVVAGCLQRDAAAAGNAFNGRPFFRILLGLTCELSPAEPASPDELPALKMLAAIAVTLEGVQPVRVPGFAFQWLELISHRHLMPKLVLAPGQAGWPHLERLLVALLRFMEPYLRNADLTDAIRNLYKGTLRVLLVLLHDFPEFLCEYHFELCNVVPPSCIQMRNLILSAFPRNMRLPDPFTPNLKVDLLSEITVAPSYRPEAAALLPAGLRAEVDAYMAARQPASFLATLKQRLLLPQHETILCGTKYSQPLLNALVFYVGIRATEALKGAQPVMHAPAVDVFQRLAGDLDTEGRYLFLNALANQLRFPNSHTHYFSCVLLFLFSEAQQEIVQEQITRVLLERLIVNRPHPWGLLITFIELIKNPRYNFWSLSFTHCDAEIERLFESVAQSCMGPHKAAEQQAAGGGQPQQGQPQLQSVGA
ncbi:hypothetical protein WJX75_008268 [Coccomyxa subellipsoidea]|uniref:Not1-domain-containing protein n=1 Tax=Coccomyxa subellipsoidea TaxID=248742 RepID=A0ABR2YZV9_9CHLO